jgi:plastocyanin
VRKTMILPILAISAIAAGCGGSAYGGGDDAFAPAKAAKAEATTATGSAQQGTVVELKDTSFQPGDVKVKAGQTIRFENEDAIAHTVTAVKGAKFDSGTLDGGRTFEFKATKAGAISYVCEFHPGMTGTITVDP